MTPHPALDEIADRILDGLPIDWSTIDADSDLLDQLKTLETLRHRRRTNAAPAPAGAWIWGHLQVLEQIGHGAYGDVHRAWDTRLDREVALKLLPSEAPGAGLSASTVIEEGRLLARVRHPNVVTIYGAERIDGRIGLWMEFVKGQTLEEALRGGRTFTAAEVTRLGAELCAAVSAVHAAGLLHCDIKAQNVMLDDGGRLVLMDFGTGRELGDSADVQIAGTPLYLAPEVLLGGGATPRSDVYSIGVLLFRLLTGSYPVSGSDLTDLRRAHAAAERTDARLDRHGIPAALRRIVNRAIDPNPDARYAGADELTTALSSTDRAPVRRGLTIAVTTVAIIVAVAGGWNLGLRQALRPVLAAVGLAPTPTIAVLPFTNAGSDPGNDDVIEGLTSDIIRNLSDIEGLQVSPLTSSLFFKDHDLRDVASRLKVDFVIQASVQRLGNRIRINAWIVRTTDQVSVWSDSYDRTLGDVFAIQDQISRAIVNELRLTLGRGQLRPQMSEAATDLYLRGLARVARRGVGDAEEAVRLFEQVIALYPANARAHAGLAAAYAAWSRPDGLSNDAGLAGMRPAALRALELDPLLPEAHAAMGITYARELRWEDSRRSFERALDSPENLTHIRSNYAVYTLLPLGETDQAEALLEAAVEVAPFSAALRKDLGMVQVVVGRNEAAIRNLTQALDYAPDTFGAANLLARALTFAGRPREAIALWESRRYPGNWELMLLPAYHMEGRHEDIARLAAAERSQEPHRQARIYAAQKDKDRTFEALNRAVDADSPHHVAFMLAFPDMAFLRGDARLDQLRTRLNLR